MREFAVQVPINSLSLGQTSIAILREMYQRGLHPCIFPIGQVDISAQKQDEAFNQWLSNCINKSIFNHDRKNPCLKIWHLNGSLESVSEKQVLLTFYELDSPTPAEINIARNNTKVLFTNSYTTEIFVRFGLNNIDFVPLGFDKHNFNVKEKTYFNDGRITFNVAGKLEKRKAHEKIIKSWIKRFGNKHGVFLQCAVYNQFLKPEDNQALFNQICEGKRYFNVNFLPFMQQNELFNDFLNSGDIYIGMSRGEGFDLCAFHSLALGKHGVILDAHAYQDYITSENAVCVPPCGKIEAYDNYFFKKGLPFNQGSIFEWDENQFIVACELAIERVRKNRVNKEGLKLQEQFNFSKTTDRILEIIDDV